MSRNTKQPIQFYRGTTAQHSGYTGPAGECTVDTTKNTLVVHDGVKAGGYPLVKEDHTVTGDGYVLANGSRSTTIGSRTLALSLDTAALRNLLADPSGTDAVAGNLKLSDAVDSSLDAATGGTAATPKAVKTAVDGAVKKTYVVKGDTYIKVDGKFSTTLDDADGLDLTLDTAALLTPRLLTLYPATTCFLTLWTVSLMPLLAVRRLRPKQSRPLMTLPPVRPVMTLLCISTIMRPLRM